MIDYMIAVAFRVAPCAGHPGEAHDAYVNMFAQCT